MISIYFRSVRKWSFIDIPLDVGHLFTVSIPVEAPFPACPVHLEGCSVVCILQNVIATGHLGGLSGQRILPNVGDHLDPSFRLGLGNDRQIPENTDVFG
ncbi:MAG: hypothetical protein CMJ81_14195 [Planctomycetaceae bacterium]|nr:hypothetical protein [Planctomycetaceae bacterium]MBP61522.1 hypothetical protein [Planctomycetaceae bacterium]